jgi:hypothetical protein
MSPASYRTAPPRVGKTKLYRHLRVCTNRRFGRIFPPFHSPQFVHATGRDPKGPGAGLGPCFYCPGIRCQNCMFPVTQETSPVPAFVEADEPSIETWQPSAAAPVESTEMEA